MDGKIYRINQEVEVKEGNKKTLRRENNKIVENGIRKIEEGTITENEEG